MNLARTTPAKTKLIEDATKDGFTVEVEPSGFFRIYKPGGRDGKRYGVYMYDPKTVYSIGGDTRHDEGLKTFKEIRAALNL